MTSTVCAIIPTYNRKVLTEECVQSLLAQTRRPDEIIIVDDGSTDGTEDVFTNYPGVTYIKKQNGGKSSALNLALSNTNADYIWICDDDDIAAPDGLEKLYDALETHAKAGFAFGEYQMFRTNEDGGKQFIKPFYKPRSNETNQKINFLEHLFTLQFAMLIRRELYDRTGAFNEDMVRSQDYEMTLRLSRHHQSVYVPHTIFYQRIHDGDRGAGHERFSVKDTEAKWLQYDQKIFKNIARDYALEEFTPSFALAWPEAHRQRATHIERALVFARRGLWDYTIGDITAGLAADNRPLTAEELTLCEAMVRKSTSWTPLFKNSEWTKKLNHIYKQNGPGENIVMALCRPLGWMTKLAVKKGDYNSALSYLCLMTSILGIKGSVMRFIISAKSGKPA